jgi:competence protein ComEC
VLVGVLSGLAALSSFAGPLTLPQGWSILACDVGQGDAVLVRDAGVVALIDTGPDAAVLDRCLARAAVRRIDLLVLTHFDLDHAGGVAAVAGRVGTVLHGPTASSDDERLLASLADRGAHLVPATAGMRGELGAARWRVLWPVERSHAFPSGNDASVVVDMRGGAVPVSLFLGDLSASAQSALVAQRTLEPPYTLVKVAHHGSADQDPDLYRIAQPAIAVFTVGAGNDYGHPRAETVAILDALGARIARTDVSGVVSLVPAGDELVVWRERGGDVAAPG